MKTKVIYRPTIEAIKKASLNLQEVALKTPLVKNDYYSKKYQSTILFKREDLEELAERKAKWIAPEPKHKKGILYKYAKTVASASKGCVTDL